MSNVDINVDRRTDGLTDGRTGGQKIGRLYRTLLQAGAIIKWNCSKGHMYYAITLVKVSVFISVETQKYGNQSVSTKHLSFATTLSASLTQTFDCTC